MWLIFLKHGQFLSWEGLWVDKPSEARVFEKAADAKKVINGENIRSVAMVFPLISNEQWEELRPELY